MRNTQCVCGDWDYHHLDESRRGWNALDEDRLPVHWKSHLEEVMEQEDKSCRQPDCSCPEFISARRNKTYWHAFN